MDENECGDANDNEENKMKMSDSESDSDSDETDTDGDHNDDDQQSDQNNIQRINQLREDLLQNPYNYEKHVEYIKLLRNSGELDLVRMARNAMSHVFPLTPQLWLEWIKDEISIASSPQEKSEILKLFERSVNDYMSDELWLEFVQFSIGLMDNCLDVNGVRQIFERSLTSVGLHVSKGSLLWHTFREFEIAILQTIDNEANIKSQIDRIFDLYKRQLSVPLLDMNQTYNELKNWCKEINDKHGIALKIDSIKQIYEKAFSELQKLIGYEEAVESSESPHLEQYLRYIEFETINGTLMRVQSIYERALTDNCLNSDLWLQYTKYCDKKIVLESLLIPIYERAVRNCPWSASLWIGYIRSLERLKSSRDQVLKVFETALQSGFQSGDDYLQIWITYLDCVRRKTDWNDENDVTSLRKTFEKAVEHVSNIENCDPCYTVLQYFAKIEAKFCRDMNKAREIYNNLLSDYNIASQAQFWIEFANLELKFGDDKHYRKVLTRGLTFANDLPESIGQMLVKFEREEGNDIKDYDNALQKYDNMMKKITEKRIITAEKEKEDRKQVKIQRKQEKYELKRATKRKTEANTEEESNNKSKANVDIEGFRIPPIKSDVSDRKKVKLEIDTKNERSKSRSQKKDKNKAEDDRPSHGVTYRSDGTKDLQTIFISNLDFNLTEDKIRETFEKFGEITDLRLVRNYKGLSKGYCYIEYSSIVSVREALKKDRMPLEGRPVFISEIGKRKQFRYSTSLEKNKLFVKNLSVDITNEELQKIFEKYGTLKEVRLVTFRNGYSKGCAYVEYVDEVSATEAIKRADGLVISEKAISVALSNPSKSAVSSEKLPRDSSQNMQNDEFSRTRSKTRVDAPMIPHALRIQRQSQNDTNNGGSNEADVANSTPMSNSDFRSMLFSNK